MFNLNEALRQVPESQNIIITHRAPPGKSINSPSVLTKQYFEFLNIDANQDGSLLLPGDMSVWPFRDQSYTVIRANKHLQLNYTHLMGELSCKWWIELNEVQVL